LINGVSVRSEEIQRRGLGRQNESDPTHNAKVAQLVEHDLAKVGVAGSNPVFRSITFKAQFFLDLGFFMKHFIHI
jgi:hypothetical protein